MTNRAVVATDFALRPWSADDLRRRHADYSVTGEAGSGAMFGECDFEYPRGSFMRCNDWAIEELRGPDAALLDA